MEKLENVKKKNKNGTTCFFASDIARILGYQSCEDCIKDTVIIEEKYDKVDNVFIEPVEFNDVMLSVKATILLALKNSANKEVIKSLCVLLHQEKVSKNIVDTLFKLDEAKRELKRLRYRKNLVECGYYEDLTGDDKKLVETVLDEQINKNSKIVKENSELKRTLINSYYQN